MNEGLWFGDRLDYSLLCPNQIRAHGLIVNDAPQQFDPGSTHAIKVPATFDNGPRSIPLYLLGIFSVFDTKRPSDDDMLSLKVVSLTDDTP